MKYLMVKECNKRYEEVDYLKGFSIFTIVLFHLIYMYITKCPPIINKLSWIGGTGVHAFFLCSGFGLYTSYLNNKLTYINFIKKRFFKIYVPYVVIVFISFLTPYMYLQTDKVTAFLSHIFLFKMFVTKYNQSLGAQFWFISTIIQFYIVFIPLCRWKEKLKKPINFLIITTLISVIWWVFVYVIGVAEVRIWNSFFLQYLWEFALGMWLAEYLKAGKKIEISYLLLLFMAIIGIGLYAAMALTSEALRVFNDIPALVGYTSLALLLYCVPFVKNVARFISNFSYELYLVHILVFTTAFIYIDANTLLEQIVLGCVSLVISFVVAIVYSKILRMIGKRCFGRE